ncbi:MAG: SRPBCC family protein [Woeseiaceae bacterium]|nr:SRPBCC family protein [Woeseiaceae bacterium]
MNRFVVTLFACLLLPMTAAAADMRTVTVDRDGKVYTMRSEVFFDVDQDTLYEVFRNWDLSPGFSSWVVDARNLEPDETGKAGFYIQNKGCVMFVCKTLVREGYVDDEPNTYIHASAISEKSDFAISNETWTFSTEGTGTVVVYELEMSPKFWVPPVIGPYVIKRKLKSDGGDALDRIEKIAQDRAAAKGYTRGGKSAANDGTVTVD